MEEKKDYYYRLGRLLHKHFNGEILSYGELVTIVKASKDDYMLALELNAAERLSKKKDDGLNNLLKNLNRLKEIEGIKMPTEKHR